MNQFEDLQMATKKTKIQSHLDWRDALGRLETCIFII